MGFPFSSVGVRQPVADSSHAASSYLADVGDGCPSQHALRIIQDTHGSPINHKYPFTHDTLSFLPTCVGQLARNEIGGFIIIRVQLFRIDMIINR